MIRRNVLLALAVPALVLAPLAMAGEPRKEQEKSDKFDPENIVAISQYMDTIAKANERFAAKDYTSAVDGYKKAIQLAPKNPWAHYLLAEAYAQAANWPEADPALAACLENSNEPKHASMKARALFLAADIQERQKKFEQAKAGWQAYGEHVAKWADSGFPQSSAERIKAIQKVIDSEKAYGAVRDRIIAEKVAAADAGAKKK